MSEEIRALRERIEQLEDEVAALRSASSPDGARRRERKGRAARRNSIRKRSQTTIWGVPLWEIASGPDPRNGEERGHARAIFAVGDVADGVFAVGGVARGGVCVGGVSLGLFSLGGISLGLLTALGGIALGSLAYGGVAVGGVAMGGAAVGAYAKGGAAAGLHAMDKKDRDPQAVEFFDKWLPARRRAE
ncbi:MAG: hypothetical protein ACT4QC_19625 [Planctomycetaceae bacterium]